jgi:hypothetical protein
MRAQASHGGHFRPKLSWTCVANTLARTPRQSGKTKRRGADLSERFKFVQDQSSRGKSNTKLFAASGFMARKIVTSRKDLSRVALSKVSILALGGSRRLQRQNHLGSIGSGLKSTALLLQDHPELHTSGSFCLDPDFSATSRNAPSTWISLLVKTRVQSPSAGLSRYT